MSKLFTHKIVDKCKKKLLFVIELKVLAAKEEYVGVITEYSAVKMSSENCIIDSVLC